MSSVKKKYLRFWTIAVIFKQILVIDDFNSFVQKAQISDEFEKFYTYLYNFVT